MKKVINTKLVSQAVNALLSNKRQGTSKVKTRAEVALTKKKMYKQKGTGNARHGAKSAPIFVGGGVAHGPKGTTNWTQSLPQTMKRQALQHALTLQSAITMVVPEITTLTGKTKIAAQLIKKVAPKAKKICVVLVDADEKLLRSLRNLSEVTPVLAAQLNALHVVQADSILWTKEAEEIVATRISGKKVAAIVAPVKSEKKPVKKSTTKTTKKVATTKPKVATKARVTKA